MGGGGAMRTVAKFATAGIRGVPSVRRASSQTAAASEVSPLQAAAWSRRRRRGRRRGCGEGGVGRIYLSSNSSECDGCSLSGHVSVMSPSHSELENKSRVTEAILNPSESNRALQAFQLLSECPEAQSVVASIACDPNIWNAIVQNPALQDFFQSQQTADFEVEETHDQRLGNLPYSDSVYAFIDSLNVLQNVKFTVSEMLSRVPNYLQNMFGFLSGQTSSAVIDARGNTKANFMDPITMGGTFMGLAVLVVMVIMLKRA
ncbi:hypothetical protein glysoja_001483 [Glycine soja]|nr:hypothetical protein glysoja_001483 [Glycine soja]